MYKHVLVYGFGPYAKYPHNITVDVIRQIRRLKLADTVTFETRFSRKMFETVLQKYQPKLVIGLGQDSRAKKIRIERRAINWRKSPTGSGRPISRHGEKYRYVPLKIKSKAAMTITYDAGDSVCNYSMYLMCEYCQNTGRKFAFLHLPLNVNVAGAATLIEEIIQSVEL